MDVESLAVYGANVEEGLARCMNNEGFYLKLVGTLKDDAHFGQLEDAVAAGRLDEAFEAAHALKGSLANLAITPLLDPVSEITELLRDRTETDYPALLGEIRMAKERFDAL